MSEAPADFAVFGSSPLAGLVAGLLATRHNAKVIAVGEAQARFRLPRMLDLSVGPITRPETWALLRATQPEVGRLINKISGRGAIRHVDPIFFADSRAAQEALGHFAHMARAFGFMLEVVPPAKLGGGSSAMRLIDATSISRPAFEPALEAWLADAVVRRIVPQSVAMAADGSVELHLDGETQRAKQSILVDDAAVLDHLPGWQWPSQLVRQSAATILTTSNQHLAGPIMMQIDTGTMLVQHEEGGMAATGPGTLGRFSVRLARLVAQSGQLQQAGQVGFDAAITTDGAPLLGQCGNQGPIVLTGLGCSGAFLAPVLARWLAGEASGDENDWCEARRADRRGLGRSVADFMGTSEERAA